MSVEDLEGARNVSRSNCQRHCAGGAAAGGCDCTGGDALIGNDGYRSTVGAAISLDGAEVDTSIMCNRYDVTADTS